MISKEFPPALRRFKKAFGTAILFIVGLCIYSPGDVASYCPANYTESAHGNSGYGVLRRAGTSSADYARGNCAHCHEQHGSIDGVSNFGPYPFGLFAPSNPTSQTDNFCFQCHCNPAASIQSNMVPNYDYGRTFGGGAEMSDNIKDAFNFGPPNRGWTTGSSHNLQYIRNGFRLTGPGSWVTLDTNACRLCHDPHTAQRNTVVTIISEPCDRPPGGARGGVETALYHPLNISQGQPRNLWGDERDPANREMQDQLMTGIYQAPFSYPGPGPCVPSGSYEPAGNAIGDGSNMPNYNRFCLGCHQYSIPNSLTDADPNTIGGRNLFPIDWSSSGNQHGEKAGSPNNDPVCANPVDEQCLPDNYDWGALKPPYNDPNANYVLSCMDCHESHGSQNAFLLRSVVNGKNVVEKYGPIRQWLGTMESGAVWEFCTACHYLSTPCGPHDCDGEPGDGVNDHLIPCQEFGCQYCHDHSRVDF